MKSFIWACRIIAAIIMLQTLFFKFTAANESVYIFSALGVEPWGRIGSGIVELIASILILYPRLSWIGAGLGLGTMMGAITSHLFILGIEVQNDHGQLFFMALITALCCGVILFTNRKTILSLIPFLNK
jgi:uncharacterized membrane protein YphA (DoxX/SURF4 family)